MLLTPRPKPIGAAMVKVPNEASPRQLCTIELDAGMTTTKDARLEVKRATGTSTYKLAALEPLPTGGAKLTVLAGDWLDMGTCPATYTRGRPIQAVTRSSAATVLASR